MGQRLLWIMKEESLPCMSSRLDFFCKQTYPHLYPDLKQELQKADAFILAEDVKIFSNIPEPLMPPNIKVNVSGLLILSRSKNPKVLDIKCIGPAPENVKSIIFNKAKQLGFSSITINQQNIPITI